MQCNIIHTEWETETDRRRDRWRERALDERGKEKAEGRVEWGEGYSESVVCLWELFSAAESSYRLAINFRHRRLLLVARRNHAFADLCLHRRRHFLDVPVSLSGSLCLWLSVFAFHWPRTLVRLRVIMTQSCYMRTLTMHAHESTLFKYSHHLL